MNSIGKIFFSLGLVFLMLLKVSAFHIYEHCDDDENHEECHLCELAMENQISESDFALPFDFTTAATPVIQTTVIDIHTKTVTDISYRLGPFSRPPPTLL